MLFNALQVCSAGSEEQRHSEEQAAKQKQRTVPLGMPHQGTWNPIFVAPRQFQDGTVQSCNVMQRASQSQLKDLSLVFFAWSKAD